MSHGELPPADDDDKDAREIGAEHTVTALYEIVPAGTGKFGAKVDDLKYQDEAQPKAQPTVDKTMHVKIRYRAPDGDQSQRFEFPVGADVRPMAKTSDDFRFSAAVAAFGMLLRDSNHRGQATFDDVSKLARGAMGQDKDGTRHELLDLVAKAAALRGHQGWAPASRAQPRTDRADRVAVEVGRRRSCCRCCSRGSAGRSCSRRSTGHRRGCSWQRPHEAQSSVPVWRSIRDRETAASLMIS